MGVADAGRRASEDGTDLADGVAEHEKELQDVAQVERGYARSRAGLARGRDRPRSQQRPVPHRDEFELSLGTLPAKGFASHGGSWSYALALRLASWDLLRSHISGDWAEERADPRPRRRLRRTSIHADGGGSPRS